VIVGAGGDLSRRFLLPALGHLLATEPDRRVRLVGASRRRDPGWGQIVATAFAAQDGPAVVATQASAAWVAADVARPDGWRQILEAAGEPATIYLALGPAQAHAACEALSRIGVPAGTRLVFEKPFGRGAAAAVTLNELAIGLVGEANVFRVDHFLATPVVLASPVLRFGNRVLAAVWDAEHIERVTVLWDEALGLAGRGEFYDATGAVRDMIQSHLLQVLAAVIMEPAAGEGGQERVVREALDSLSVWDDPRALRRARWTSGTIGGEPARAYADEPGVVASRETETLAQVVMRSDLPRWRGVPLVLRSGKGLDADRRYVEIRFRAPGMLADADGRATPGDVLRIDMLTGALELDLVTADPAEPRTPVRVRLTGGIGTPSSPGGPDEHAVVTASEAAIYGRVLKAVLDGDRTLSVSTEAAVRCWRLVEPILAGFGDGGVPLEEYPAGSAGPRGWDDVPA